MCLVPVVEQSVHCCRYAACGVIKSEMVAQCIAFPDMAKAQEIMERTHLLHHVPQVYDSVDGMHISILTPAIGYWDYGNRQGRPSIVLQVVVDDQLLIRDVCVGNSGSVHDAAIFNTSSLLS